MFLYNRLNYIKFRAWDIEKKAMKMVTQIDFLKVAVKENIRDNGKICDVWIDGSDTSTFPNKTECVLMQFINYTTKYKKEVYEGDIICSMEYPERKFVIIFDSTTMSFNAVWTELIINPNDIEVLGQQNKINFYWLDNYSFDVIGNIFENPEMVGEGFDPLKFIYTKDEKA